MSSVSKYTNSNSSTQMPIKMKCPICLENRKFEFNCSTCNEGGFCLDCYKNISKHSFAFEGTNVRDMINCPCCRSPNWYWLLKDILIWFEGDVDGTATGCKDYNILKNPCMYVYKKNRDENYKLTKFKAFYDEVMYDLEYCDYYQKKNLV